MSYFNPKCPNCGAIYFTTDSNKVTKCDECKADLILEPVTDPLDIIHYADMELEGANMHNISAHDLWSAVKRTIPKKNRIKAAEAIVGWCSGLG